MKILLYLLNAVFVSGVYSQQEYTLEIPKLGDIDTVVNHVGYAVSYNTKYRQANWVAYILTKKKTEAVVERNNHFIADPFILRSNNQVDYEKSGYDRGHLAPAADMSYSEVTMKESFYFSNISAQVPGFNRGIWKVLEGQVRSWAVEYDSLYITVGPIYTLDMKAIGPDSLAVPNSYYKTILDNHKGKEKMIGFVMNNEKSDRPLASFSVSVDSIEKLIGIDLYPQLSDELEVFLESQVVLENWNFLVKKDKKTTSVKK